MSSWTKVKGRYEHTKNRIAGSVTCSTLNYTFLSLFTLGLGVWALVLYRAIRASQVDNRCFSLVERALLGTAVVTLVEGVGIFCLGYQVRSTFFRFVEQTGEIIRHHQDYQPLTRTAPDYNDQDVKVSVKEPNYIATDEKRSTAEKITDGIGWSCCSSCFFIITFLITTIFLIYGLASTRSLHFHTNTHVASPLTTQTAAAGLIEVTNAVASLPAASLAHARHTASGSFLSLGLTAASPCQYLSESDENTLSSFKLHLTIFFSVYLASICIYFLACGRLVYDLITLYDIHFAQQELIKHLDAKSKPSSPSYLHSHSRNHSTSSTHSQ